MEETTAHLRVILKESTAQLEGASFKRKSYLINVSCWCVSTLLKLIFDIGQDSIVDVDDIYNNFYIVLDAYSGSMQDTALLLDTFRLAIIRRKKVNALSLILVNDATTVTICR